MSIELLTTSGTITPKDDAVLYRAAMQGQDRILSGCELSIVNTSQIKITSGYLLICGRVCKVSEETLTVALSSSGTQTKYLFVSLSPLAYTPVSISSFGSWSAGSDINANESGNYMGLLATYTATTSAVLTLTENIFSANSRVQLFTGGTSETSGTTGNLIVPAYELDEFKTLYILDAYKHIHTIALELWGVGDTTRLNSYVMGEGSDIWIELLTFKLKRNATNIEILDAGILTISGQEDENAIKTQIWSNLYISKIFGSII